MLERTIIYVDTSYLLASFYNTWATGARAQLEIDLPEVVNVLESRAVNQLNQPVHRQNWYDGIPDSGPHRYQRALRSCPGVQLRAGQLIEWGDRRTQKAVDTRLVADMVIGAAHGDVTDIILVSGDADMLPGVEESVARGVRVHLYGFGWDSMSSNLRYACDTTTILDPREHFGDCMRLEVLEGPLKPGGATDTAEDSASDSSSDSASDSASDSVVETEEAGPATDGADTPDATKDSESAENVAHKPIGDAEPVEDLSGTSAVPDVRRKSKSSSSSSSVPSPADLANGGPLPSSTSSPAPATEPTKPVTPTQGSETSGPAGPTGQQDADDCDGAEEAAAAGAAAAEPVNATGTAGTAGTADAADTSAPKPTPGRPTPGTARPTPAMMAPRRRLRNRYVPLPTEIWQSGGQQNPFDIGEQYAIWWYHNAIDEDQRREAHTYTGGGLPPEINRPLLQFACETLHEYTLTESQRVNLRDGFHSGIRGIIMKKS